MPGLVQPVFPSAEVYDSADGTLVDSVTCRQDSLGDASLGFLYDGCDIGFGQFRPRTSFTSSKSLAKCGVHHVFSSRQIFKICCTVICRFAIDVVNFLAFWRQPKKCAGNKTMNLKALLFSSRLSKHHLQSSGASIQHWFSNTPLLCSSSSCGSSYSPKVGGLIILQARYRFPYFFAVCDKVRIKHGGFLQSRNLSCKEAAERGIALPASFILALFSGGSQWLA